MTYTEAIAALKNINRWTDSTIDDITDIFDEGLTNLNVEDYDADYFNLLMPIVNALRTREITVGDLDAV